ncbi:NAD(P)/FAD-dependent oxidoreductase [Clostridium brassicae]|uniref:FAD-dependent oxidoreductase n=1 Tax=Clostridium brassicae TaxID=2999072 RepID=A0ABT4DE90_9CLOT|nr:FAD-dependent oxidoreductase [Clostridium brassicae]MCY6960639.1 FAD-dependent oxidoreductase [Clostridium brassicae]
MNLVSGKLFWTNIDGIPNKYSYLSEDICCDVLIIGGGITGALCAYYFANAGINTVVVDKNIIGYGSTSASTSILQYEIDTNLIGLKRKVGMDNAVKAFKLCQEAVYDIEGIVNKLGDKCDFILNDCLYYTNKFKDVAKLKEEFDMRKKCGFDVELIDESNYKDRFSFPIKCGIYSKNGGGGINPYRFTHALLANASDKGALVYENTEIVSILSEEGSEVAVTKNGFKIKANKILIAEGFESRKRINKNVAKFTRSFTIVTKPIENFRGWNNKCIIRDSEIIYTYLRVTADNRIMIGGEDIEIGGERSKICNLADDDWLANEKYKILEEKLKLMFPYINNIQIDYRFNGLFGETKDSLPYIGVHKDMPNYYFCMGYGSNGILYNVIGGQLLRDLHIGKNPKELSVFGFDR